MIGAPLVYVGPTLAAAAVSELYPGCIVRPPIRRGDLYRDRMLRGAVFLILDGVFHQDEAISPREILDVMADGAFVAGASSMGALRAAECWPAGMRGVGSIYRLFRSGALESDDEVAVAFAQTPAGATSSVSLVNVRFAARQARRSGHVNADEEAKLVAAAKAMFYADRYWPAIVRAAGLQDRLGLAAELAARDLKAFDARRALARLTRWLSRDPSVLERPRVTTRGFKPSDESRERSHDARQLHVFASSTDESERAQAAPAIADDAQLRVELARWLFASGRHMQHAAPLLAAIEALPPNARSSRPPREHRSVQGRGAGLSAQPGVGSAQRALRTTPSPGSQEPQVEPSKLDPRAVMREALETADASLADLGFAASARTRAAYVAVVTHHARARALFADFAANQTAYADLVWLVLSVTDELDAELFHLHALRAAVARARERGGEPTTLDRHAAELRIATTHGFPTWAAFMESLAGAPEARALVLAHCADAARARIAISDRVAPLA
jgi:hypothetical protein